MKAIKDCEWQVLLCKDPHTHLYKWIANIVKGDYGGYMHQIRGNPFTRHTNMVNHFKKFAKLNGITKYKFI